MYNCPFKKPSSTSSSNTGRCRVCVRMLPKVPVCKILICPSCQLSLSCAGISNGETIHSPLPRVPLYLSYLSISVSVSVPISISLYFSIALSISLYLYIYLSPLSLPLCLYLSLYLYFSLYFSLYLSLSPSLFLSISIFHSSLT